MDKELLHLASQKGQKPVTMSGSNQMVLTEVAAVGCTWCVLWVSGTNLLSISREVLHVEKLGR